MKKKRFLFFFVHPSKYHVFRHTINELKERGHEVDVTITTKDVLEELVRNEGWEYTNIFPEGRKMLGLPTYVGASINLVRTLYRLNKFIGKTKYDLFITDDLLTITGKLKGVPSILFQDDDLHVVKETALLMLFASHILSPHCTDMGRYNQKKVSYLGYKELGGLHPNRFKPNKDVIKQFQKKDAPFSIIRLVLLRSTHDVGKKGLDNKDLKKLISILKERGDVFISAERDIPKQFKKHQIKIRANDIPHVLYYADLFIGDSQTMSTEAAMLGTPFIRYNDFVGKISTMNEIEKKYKLGYGILTKDKDKFFKNVTKLAADKDLKKKWKKKRQAMLDDKIDLTAFLIWFFETYPTSANKIMKDVDYQRKFQ